jgi:lipoprotein-anchoring transpeptidase ErfK/SrfK
MYNVLYAFLVRYWRLGVVIDKKFIQTIQCSLLMILFSGGLGINHAVAQQASSVVQAQTASLNKENTVYLLLKLHERKLYVYQGDKVIASYPVAVGKKGWETPTGSFQVLQMLRNPSWQNPFNGTVIPAGAENPLGERWIGFWSDGKNTIGFHGTPGENLIGQAVSHGCVRMRNLDVKSLFEKVRVGTTVVVQN